MLVDTYVGPYTSIGADCELRDAEIEHSVVMLESSRILGVHRLHDSLLGREVEVMRSGERPAGHPPRARRPLASRSGVTMANVRESELIAGVYHVVPETHRDARGLFVETYRREWIPGAREMIQANRADRSAGSIVGLHYHLHQADYWYVPVGAARAVLHDLRVGSPTEGATEVFDLGGDTHPGVFIPPGLAHGFGALTDMTITYLVDGYYNAADELGVAWDDPEIAADWGVTDPVLSARDVVEPEAGRDQRAAAAGVAVAHMKLLVTGGAGFIGSNFVREWADVSPRRRGGRRRRTHVRGQPREPHRCAARVRARRHRRPRSHGRRVARRSRIDVIVNFAAESHNSYAITNPGAFFRTNVVGTQTLCEAARRVGVARFHHISTCEVYGDLALDSTGALHGVVAVPAAHALQRVEGRRRPCGARLLRDVRTADHDHELREQLRAVPVPREGHSAVRDACARRAIVAVVRVDRRTGASGST